MPIFRSSRYRLAPGLPDLTEIQQHKFRTFLTQGISRSLRLINPIHLHGSAFHVVFYPDLYQFVAPKLSEYQAFHDKKTYEISLYVPGHLFHNKKPVEGPQWLCLGRMPLMTHRGHFIINGYTRVMVHQILRRPGVYFKEKFAGTEKRVIWADFICQRGSWVRIERDKKKRFWFRLKRTPKIDLNLAIKLMDYFEKYNKLTPKSTVLDRLADRLETWSRQRKFHFDRAAIYLLCTRLKNPKFYTLGSSARYQINGRLKLSLTTLQLTAADFRQTKEHLIALDQNRVVPDDIDNLANRRIRTSSELYQFRLNNGLLLLTRSMKQKLGTRKNLYTARQLLDKRPFNKAFRACFFLNPLAQFLDQVNPLSDVTHKRRIYATGPGGVSQENASLAMRSIHPSYYGRLCPIETPEGKRAGLVNSLAVFGRVTKDGALQTPYYRVFKGQVQTRGGLSYVTTAQEQGGYPIAPIDLRRDCAEVVSGAMNVPARVTSAMQEDFVMIPREQMQYTGLAPAQLMAIATSLIPFIEHDDANRALMGSNMQRQTVPVIRPVRPIVSTGLETLVVGESGQALLADRAGLVSYVSGSLIKIENRLAGEESMTTRQERPKVRQRASARQMSKLRHLAKASLMGTTTTTTTTTTTAQRWLEEMSKTWPSCSTTRTIDTTQRDSRKPPLGQNLLVGQRVQSFERSNQATALTQRPVVREGQWVQRGDLLADCAASIRGHLALGHNLFIAYLPWEGYNFEDAVVISERLIFDDLYTTVHIEKYETEARRKNDMIDERQIITKNLEPVISQWEKQVLDNEGIIRVGRWVEPGDILVRKIARQKPTPLNPYLRLAFDILEKKAPTNKDISLRVPRGVRGRVINTQVLSRMQTPPLIRAEYEKMGLQPPATLPLKVRVFIGEKRVIQIGDKVAGRHGNKGIISCILPRQDMPYFPDGQAVDMVLNPLGVPSRMNVGQVFECLLGLAGSYLKQECRITPFDEMIGAEASRSIVFLKLYQARLKTKKRWLFQPNFPGKSLIFDGRTGDCFEQFVTIGCGYMLKLVHLVEEKIHARTTGRYAMVTEQPVGGRSRGGGQRLGEMEVWALEAYGAAYTLQEMLTTKSDDFEGRTSVTENILDPVWKVNPKRLVPEHLSAKELDKLNKPEMRKLLEEEGVNWVKDFRYKAEIKYGLGLSDAFRLLVRELQSLCLDVGVYALTVPSPKKGPDYDTSAIGEDLFINYDEEETEVPVSKKEIQLCSPLEDDVYYHHYSRQFKSQFGFDF